MVRARYQIPRQQPPRRHNDFRGRTRMPDDVRAQGELDLSIGVGALLEAGLSNEEIHALVDQTIEIASNTNGEFEAWNSAKSFDA